MKQEIPSRTSASTTTISSSTTSTTTPSRFRATPKPTKDPSRSDQVNGVSPGLKSRPKSVPPDPNNAPKVRRSLGLNKLKSSEDVVVVGVGVGSQRGSSREVSRQVVEQFSRTRQNPSSRRNEEDPDGKKKELQEKLSASENLVKNLQSEVWELKTQVENLQNLNVELEAQNKKFAQDFAAAQERISVLSTQNQKGESVEEKFQSPNFKDVQKLIANKLENLGVKKNAVPEGSKIHSPFVPKLNPVTKAVAVQPKVSPNAASLPSQPTPPPPPPPPLPRVPAKAATTKRAPALVDFYHTLTKAEGKKDAQGAVNHNNKMVNNAHNSIVDEIQNRSAHLLAIKLDVDTKGEFVKSLIEKVQAAAYTDIEDVSKFVAWLDRELSSLADERAVLKHFNWPERKADAMREAAIEYRDLKQLETEVSSYEDDLNVPCETALKKINGLLDKSERSIHRLVKLRDSTMVSYRDCKIPVDWMLDAGMVRKIKQASMKLAKIYMKRVCMELQSGRTSERESTQEALLLQSVRFAYKAHQFAGGLDSETMRAFEEIKKRLPVHMGGSRQLLAGVASSS